MIFQSAAISLYDPKDSKYSPALALIGVTVVKDEEESW